jgi:hypothetical protein
MSKHHTHDKHPSESARIQDERKNTTTGKVINPGSTNAEIEIVKHATPAVDAAIRGLENADKETHNESAEHKDSHSWKDAGAKSKAEKAEHEKKGVQSEMTETRKQAAHAVSDKGQLKDSLDPHNPQKDGFKKVGK